MRPIILPASRSTSCNGGGGVGDMASSDEGKPKGSNVNGCVNRWGGCWVVPAPHSVSRITRHRLIFNLFRYTIDLTCPCSLYTDRPCDHRTTAVVRSVSSNMLNARAKWPTPVAISKPVPPDIRCARGPRSGPPEKQSGEENRKNQPRRHDT
jgi:hypothetical protein